MLTKQNAGVVFAFPHEVELRSNELMYPYLKFEICLFKTKGLTARTIKMTRFLVMASKFYDFDPSEKTPNSYTSVLHGQQTLQFGESRC